MQNCERVKEEECLGGAFFGSNQKIIFATELFCFYFIKATFTVTTFDL